MELYIIRYGKRGDSKYLCDAKTLVHPRIMDNLVRRYGFPFWFHLISKMQTFHRGASKSLFYWTLMMEYRGLSRFGRFLQAVCHVGMDVRTYDRWRKSEVDKYSKLLTELSTFILL